MRKGLGPAGVRARPCRRVAPVPYPVVVGGGTPFLPPVTEAVRLDLVETRVFGSRVICGMAMNLRLDDQDAALLKSLAEAQDVSMHEAVLRAIRRSAWELGHTARVREATVEMQDRWGDVLRSLGEA